LGDCSFNNNEKITRLIRAMGQMINGAKLRVINAPLSSAINSAKGFGRLRILSGMDVIFCVWLKKSRRLAGL
jgi:hypothetical protein